MKRATAVKIKCWHNSAFLLKMAEQIIGFSGHTPANLAVTTLLSSWFFGKLLDESDAWRSDIIPVQVHFAGNVEELVLFRPTFFIKIVYRKKGRQLC